MRAGSTSQLPGAATWMAGYGSGRKVVCEDVPRKSLLTVTDVRTVWNPVMSVSPGGAGIELTGTERAA